MKNDILDKAIGIRKKHGQLHGCWNCDVACKQIGCSQQHINLHPHIVCNRWKQKKV